MNNLLENILNSFESLRANKMRTALSMLGIIIGVSSVIILNAIGNGGTDTIMGKIEEMGANVLTIAPNTNSSSKDRAYRKDFLTNQLVEIIEKNVSGLNGILPIINSAGKIIYNKDDMNVAIYGVNEKFLPLREIDLEFGKNFNTENLKNNDKVVIIGKEVYKDLFNRENPVGKKIKLGNSVYKVIGFIESNMIYDSAIFVPITTTAGHITGTKYYSSIAISVTDKEKVLEKQAEIDILLKDRLKIIDKDSLPYKLSNQQQLLDYVEETMSTMTTLLAYIAAISLIVGGIGIMNIMLVSVSERTKEIGIRKAIGASGQDILIQFLVESSILSLLGGGAGIFFSYLVCLIVAYFGVAVSISTTSIIMSFSVSLFIGLLFGITPAYKAAQLRPIQALRFE